MGRGLVVFQSLPTIKKGPCLFNFQSNELFLKSLRQQIAISKLKSDAFRENTRCVCVDQGIHRPITLNLKKGTRTSDYRSNEPFPKFIRSSFLYIPYMPPGHNLQPLPRRSWGVFIIKNIISRPFNYVEQNDDLKIWLGWVWGNGGCRRRVSCPPIAFDY